jgi:predicted phosphodiesterase
MNQTRLRVLPFIVIVGSVLLWGCASAPSSTEQLLPSPTSVPLQATATITSEGILSETSERSITETIPATPTTSPTTTGRFVQFNDELARIEYALPITIQHISQTSAWLFFELASPVSGEVFYWVDGQEDLGVLSVEFSADSARHIIQLNDMLPDTKYRIRIGLPDTDGGFRSPGLNGEPWGDTLLRTYPESLDHLRVAVIGDSGFGEEITYALAAQIASKQVDLVIHTGDVVYNASENGTPLRAYQAKYFWPFQKVLLQAPIYAVPGNHEYYSDASIDQVPYYFNIFPRLSDQVQDGSWFGSDQAYRNWYAIRLMDVQILFLESQRFYLTGGAAEETEWLKKALAEFSGPTIGVYHIATYTSGRHEDDGLPIRQYWLPYFKQANTELILSGHDHNYERLRVDGLDFIVSGGGSLKLYGADQRVEGSQVFARESHFVLLDIYADRIEVETLNAFGDSIDKATLEIEG